MEALTGAVVGWSELVYQTNSADKGESLAMKSFLSPSERQRRAMLADRGLRAIRDRQAHHDALCGPVIDAYRRQGMSWGRIAGLMDLSHEPPATARGMVTAAPWTRAAVRRIWLRWSGTHPTPGRCTETMEMAL